MPLYKLTPELHPDSLHAAPEALKVILAAEEIFSHKYSDGIPMRVHIHVTDYLVLKSMDESTLEPTPTSVRVTEVYERDPDRPLIDPEDPSRRLFRAWLKWNPPHAENGEGEPQQWVVEEFVRGDWEKEMIGAADLLGSTTDRM